MTMTTNMTMTIWWFKMSSNQTHLDSWAIGHGHLRWSGLIVKLMIQWSSGNYTGSVLESIKPLFRFVYYLVWKLLSLANGGLTPWSTPHFLASRRHSAICSEAFPTQWERDQHNLTCFWYCKVPGCLRKPLTRKRDIAEHQRLHQKQTAKVLRLQEALVGLEENSNEWVKVSILAHLMTK